jgi:hypothetical protein
MVLEVAQGLDLVEMQMVVAEPDQVRVQTPTEEVVRA